MRVMCGYYRKTTALQRAAVAGNFNFYARWQQILTLLTILLYSRKLQEGFFFGHFEWFSTNMGLNPPEQSNR